MLDQWPSMPSRRLLNRVAHRAASHESIVRVAFSEIEMNFQAAFSTSLGNANEVQLVASTFLSVFNPDHPFDISLPRLFLLNRIQIMPQRIKLLFRVAVEDRL